METQLPYDTLRTIESELLQRDEVPLFGKAPEFPLENVQKALSQLFEKSDLQIAAEISSWKNDSQVSQELGANPFLTGIKIPIFSSLFYWAASAHDVEQFSLTMIDPQASSEVMIDSEFQQAFYSFCLLETLHVLQNLNYATELPMQLLATSRPLALPREPILEIPITLSTSGKKFTAFLLLPQDFLNEWRQYFVPRKPSYLSSELRQQLDVTVSIESGGTTLSQEEWNQLKIGDLLLLDSCSVDPTTGSGDVILTAYGKPIFHAQLSPDGIQLQEPVMHQEKS